MDYQFGTYDDAVGGKIFRVFDALKDACDGKWRNRYEQTRYTDRIGAETGARFCEEWGDRP